MAKETFYVTTAIDYVNAKPHVGHAFEKTLADALARYKRLQGFDVFFLTGVDENAQKNVEAAEKAGVNVKEFIDKNANLFLELCKKLNLSNDDFIRTTEDRHKKVVKKALQILFDKKDYQLLEKVAGKEAVSVGELVRLSVRKQLAVHREVEKRKRRADEIHKKRKS